MKSWVIASDVDTVKTENTARMDLLIENTDLPVAAVAEEEGGKTLGDVCSSLGDVCSSLGVVPYAVTTFGAQGDSGCCLCSANSGEGEAGSAEHRSYRNAYCTLSDRQSDLPEPDPAAAAAARGEDEHAPAVTKSFFFRKAQGPGLQLSGTA